MADQVSWPDDRVWIDEYVLEFRGEETLDLDDKLVADDDTIVIKDGVVRAPEPGCNVPAHIDFVAYAKEFLTRYLTKTVAVRLDRVELDAALTTAKAAKIKVECPFNPKSAKARAKSVSITGADWLDYLALEPPEWPAGGYVVDCMGKVDSVDREELDSVVVEGTEVVIVQSGAIVIDDGEDLDLMQHLVQWLGARSTVTLIARARKDRSELLDAWITQVGGQLVEAAPDAVQASPSP